MTPRKVLISMVVEIEDNEDSIYAQFRLDGVAEDLIRRGIQEHFDQSGCEWLVTDNRGNEVRLLTDGMPIIIGEIT